MKISIKQKRRLTGHSGPVYALEKCGSDFIAGGSDKIAVKWNCNNDEGTLIAKSLKAIFSLKYLSESGQLLIGNDSGSIHVIKYESKTEERMLQFHSAPVFEIGRLSDMFYSLGGDGIISFFNADFRLLWQERISTGKLRNAAFIDGRLFIADSTGSVSIYNFIERNIEFKWLAHTEGFGVNRIIYINDKLITASRDARLNIYSLKDYSLIRSIPAHKGAIYDIAMHHSGKLFATAARDKTIKIWDANSFEVLERIDDKSGGHAYSVNALLWNDCLISAGDDRSIICWEVSLH